MSILNKCYLKIINLNKNYSNFKVSFRLKSKNVLNVDKIMRKNMNYYYKNKKFISKLRWRDCARNTITFKCKPIRKYAICKDEWSLWGMNKLGRSSIDLIKMRQMTSMMIYYMNFYQINHCPAERKRTKIFTRLLIFKISKNFTILKRWQASMSLTWFITKELHQIWARCTARIWNMSKCLWKRGNPPLENTDSLTQRYSLENS